MKQNILLIMADQLTPFMLGAYGQKAAITPNIDELAKNGVLYQAAYSPCPLCAPARAAMMTGLFPSNVHVYDNGTTLSTEIPTMADYLNVHGYDTALSGKMHFVGPDQKHGFAKRFTTDIYPSSNLWLFDKRMKDRDKYASDTGNKAIAYQDENCGVLQNPEFFNYDDESAFKAKEYIRFSQREGKPFFLCASFHHPHIPLMTNQRLWDLYEGVDIPLPEFPENMEETYSAMDKTIMHFTHTDEIKMTDKEQIYKARRSYLALTTFIDEKVGELIAELKDYGLYENTTIIFTSDHGDMLCEKGMVEKRVFYEWSNRIPMIIKYADGTGTGTEVSDPVSLIDILPTILDVADYPMDKTFPYDGVSMLDTAKNGRDIPVFTEYHVEGVEQVCIMMRTKKYKYIYIHGHKHQLFDMENDKNEWNNLIDNPEFKDVKDELLSVILAKFNPEIIEDDIQEKLRYNAFIRRSVLNSGVSWDFLPEVDNQKNYVRAHSHFN